MSDPEKKEKVIKGLERCTQPIRECADGCPYSCKEYIYEDCRDILMANALALLKAQETVNPNTIMLGDMVMYYQCPACLATIDNGNKVCPGCGRAVKWDG